jgi:hypothetical protein
VAALGIPKNSASPSTKAIRLHLEIPTSHGFRTLNALLDSGAEENFISQRIVAEAKLLPTPVTTRVRTINGRPITIYGRHALEAHARDERGLDGHTEQNFLATDLIGYDVILGFPWLQAVNPDVNWEKGTWVYRFNEVEGAEEVNA